MRKFTIDMLSDTHNQHDRFKCDGGDILLHAGDCTGRGTLSEAIAFLEWFSIQPYQFKVMIAGNHDWIFEERPTLMADECRNRGIHLLNDSGLIIKDINDPDIQFKIWGSPVQPWFHSWAFNRGRTIEESSIKNIPYIQNHWDLIPVDTEILITHGPAHGILDEVKNPLGDSYRVPINAGCEKLKQHIDASKIALHVSGHIHEGRGFHYEKNTTYVNASSLDQYYGPAANRPMRVIREMLEDGSVLYVV